jgi:WD40 repeat protein
VALAVVAAGAAGVQFPPAANAADSATDRHGDPLPQGALLRLGTVRYRAGQPNDAALSPDGKILATASSEDVTLWDVATGRPLHRLRGAEVPPDCSPNQTFLCFSPDGKQLVTLGGWDLALILPGTVPKSEAVARVWEVASGEEVCRFDLLGGTKREHYAPARYVWFTPGGKEIGVVLHGGVVRFLDPANGRENRRWGIGQPLRQECPGTAASPDGKLLAVVDSKDEKSLLLYDVLTGREVRRLTAAATLANVAFSPDSALLAAADDGAVIRLFEVATGKESKSFSAPVVKDENLQTGLMSLTFSADGKVLYAGSQRGQILRWSMPGAEVLPSMPEQEGSSFFFTSGWVSGIYPSPDGRSVVSVSWGNGLIRRWDTATGKEIPTPEGFTGRVCSRLSPDKRQVAVGDTAGTLALFDAVTGQPSRVFRASGPAVTALHWSRDGKTLAVGQGNSEVSLWDAGSAKEVRLLHLPSSGATVWVDALAFSPDGRHLLTSHFGPRMWDVTTGEERWGGNTLSAAVLSPDGKTVAARSMRNELVLLEAASGAVRASHRIRSRTPFTSLASIAFSPDGSRLATAHTDGTIRLHHPKTGEELSHFEGPKDAGSHSLAFSQDGKWLLAGGADKVVRLWEAASGKELLHLSGHEGAATAEFGAGLNTAVSSSLDSTVLVWDLRQRAGAAATDPAALWADLAADDGPKVYRAVRALADDPKASVALLREKLPVRSVDEKRIRQLAAGLDADAFADREKATRELSELGAPAVPLLKKLQQGSESAEVRRRLQEVVDGLTRREAEDFRRSRSVQVLELAATAEARQLLRDWSAGASTVALAEDARAALGRLEQVDKVRRAGDKP